MYVKKMLTFVFFFFLFSLSKLLFPQVKGLWADGEFEEARIASRLAKKWSIAGLIFAILAEVVTGVVFLLKNMQVLNFG